VSRLPIRVRLALLFALAMAIVLVGAGWFVYARVAHDLERALDEQLRSRAQDVSALVARGGSLDGTGGPLIEPGESFAQLVAADGRVLDASRPLGTGRLLSGQELEEARRGPIFGNRPFVRGLDEPARLLALPLARDGQQLVVVVGATRENRSETLDSLLTAFLVGGPVALLLAAGGGYLLAGAALRPVEAMRRRAAEISTASLDERLPVPPAADELSRLSETLNEMLARIESGVERERRFVADASHELRTPLALLETELELALRGDRSRDELRAAIQSAAAETDRLSQIAGDLLLLATSERGGLPLHVEPLDVADVLETVARRFRARAEADGRAVVVENGEAQVVEADRIRLEQALGNMLDNGLRHGAGDVRLRAFAANGLLELHVADAGLGFPGGFLERAFERFSRPDGAGARGGSGLGLAIVATIARAHGGEAHAANRPAGGADVWIALPLR
jgi:signal transduction histidine kinase